MSKILYFTYGSNMLEARLQQRCPSARAVGAARLTGWTLRFDKRSMDGSGKATIEASNDPDCVVHGVLYEIAGHELDDLDRAEGYGKGYDRRALDVWTTPSETKATATAYVADATFIDRSLQPYDWYHELIVAGAKEHHLPDAYVNAINAVPSIADPEPNRPSRREALTLLREISRS